LKRAAEEISSPDLSTTKLPPSKTNSSCPPTKLLKKRTQSALLAKREAIPFLIWYFPAKKGEPDIFSTISAALFMAHNSVPEP